MMAGRNAGEEIQYRNTMDCWRKLMQQEGVNAFFKGGASNVMRGAGGVFKMLCCNDTKVSYLYCIIVIFLLYIIIGALVLVLYDEIQKLFGH